MLAKEPLRSDHSETPCHDRSRLRVLPERVVLATTAALAYAGVAVLAFRVWIAEATQNANAPQPIGLTVSLCLLVAVVLALVQLKNFASVVVMAFCGLIVGCFLFPTSSMRPGTRLEAILSGEFVEFTPFALCLGTLLGTIVGQNLTEARRGLNYLNASCCREWSTGTNHKSAGQSEEQRDVSEDQLEDGC